MLRRRRRRRRRERPFRICNRDAVNRVAVNRVAVNRVAVNSCDGQVVVYEVCVKVNHVL